MPAPEWLYRFRAASSDEVPQPESTAIEAGETGANAVGTERRPLQERLKSTLRRSGEGLAPRVLRRVLNDLQSVVDRRISDVEAGRRADALAAWYADRPASERRDVWLLMSDAFAPDVRLVAAAQKIYETSAGTDRQSEAEVRLRWALTSSRARLLQRFAVNPGGIRFLMEMRCELRAFLREDSRLLALDAELENSFSNWFDVAFLELRRISWDSPASLIEKLIKYEAVHDIQSWSDVKNRLDRDRRCYGFFHARLPNEPLIFVEVALVRSVSESIAPLLDEAAVVIDAEQADTAIFYSISATQPGLHGVSFGDSLIKRVVETLRGEFPRLKTFATLSPMPGFRAWFAKNADAMLGKLDEKRRAGLARAMKVDQVDADRFFAALEDPASLDAKSPIRQLTIQCAAYYLAYELPGGKPADPVARFHLGNGARVERLNWAADASEKGLRQSWGLMVNYFYDLKRLDKHRDMLAEGRVAISGEVEALAKI